MAKIKINYNGNIVSLKGLKTLKKEEGVSSVSMKKNYGFTAKQITEFESNGLLAPYLIGKTKYYKKDEVIKLL